MFKDTREISDWIIKAENMRTRAAGDIKDGGYLKNREYYENYQKPDDVRDDIAYVVRNLIWDYVNRFVAKLVGSKVQPVITGAGPMGDPIMQLLLDILEENKFHELLLEDHGNMFAVEGVAAWKCMFDPYELCNYGLGMPKIFNLYYDEVLLDPNARSGSHDDDRARCHVKQMLLDEAVEKWGTDLQTGQTTEMADKIHESFKNRYAQQTAKFVDVYEVEFYRQFLVPHVADPTLPGNMKYRPVAEWDDEKQRFIANEEGQNTDPANIIPIRLCKYFMQPVINGDVFPERARLTGYDGYTIIPSLNVYRRTNELNWPASNVHMQVDRQDSINVQESLILEALKTIAKNNYIISAPGGVRDSDVIEMKRKFGGIGEIIVIKTANASVQEMRSGGIPPALLQKLNIDLQAFDDSGSTGDPDRGQGEVQRSGRAEIALQTRADLPMVIPKLHLENGLNQLFLRLTEMIVRKMTKPFAIDRVIDGQERQIRFNYPVGQNERVEDGRIDELHVVTEREGQQIINSLSDFKIPRIKVDVEMNVLGKENTEIQKAFAMFEKQQLAPIHLHKAVYPKKWQETFEEAQKWNQAMAFMQKLAEMGPEAMQAATEMVDTAIQTQQAVERAQGGGRNGR